MREASSLVLSARLQADGAHDPRLRPDRRARGARRSSAACTSRRTCSTPSTGADAVVLVTEWDEFLALDWAQVAERMAGTLVLDGRNALDAERGRAPPA